MSKKKKSHSRKPSVAIKSELKDYDYHLPVLLKECVDALMNCGDDGLYIDGTLGGGGHTAEILSRLSSKGRVYSFDADPDAIAHCNQKFSEELSKEQDSRLILVNKNFVEASTLKYPEKGVSGILLDLGVSSRQLDIGQRGISYRFNTKLDMRFGTDGISAEELLNKSEEGTLHHILRSFGEEPFARIIARRLVERRRAAPLKSTADLRYIIEECVPPHMASKSLARVFQAIRIAVNNELEVLEHTIRSIIPLLNKGGRIVVLSYHSLEDRVVKQVFKDSAKKTDENPDPQLHIITPKPLEPSEQEIGWNPRSRSAKLRIAEKI